VVLCRWRRAEMWRLIHLAECRTTEATGTDRHIARCIVAAIDTAPDVLTDRPLDPDGLLAWLFRFRGAAERLERVARVGP
jgi:hypothetical protein